MNSKWLSFLKKRRNEIYQNPDSILKKYDDFLAMHDIYFALDRNLFLNSIKGHTELCDGILEIYAEAKLENERLALLEDLAAIGYDKNKLVPLILSVFQAETLPVNLWQYADLLYSLRNFHYLPEYLTIIRNPRYAEARQMLILLVGKSKDRSVIPLLMELVNDEAVYGHALQALSNFHGDEITEIMRKFLDCDVRWVRRIAERYHQKILREDK